MKSIAQSGQAAVEYLVVASTLAVALFYPIADQGPVVTILVRVLMDCFRSQSFVISVL
ncbi:MAG: hypothetical protein ABI616_13010 [Pseudomonadota bacterium]